MVSQPSRLERLGLFFDWSFSGRRIQPTANERLSRRKGGRLHVYNERSCRPLGARGVEAVLRSNGASRPRLMCQITGPVYLPVVFLSSRGRGLISSLGCVLLGHVFALPRRAVKTRAFPVVNTCLGVNPHLAMASAQRGRVSRFLGRASCRRWSCGRTRFPLSLRFLGSRFCFRGSRW